jgi:DNA-binding transcriptional LysR family regulator
MKHRNLRRYFRHGTLTQLSVFEAVARNSSFTRAAEELHMAQPTVSVQVKKLAETIGLPLFKMVGKRVQMTAAGRELYAACQDIFLNIAAVEERLARLRAPDTEILRLAVSTTAKYFAPRVLAKFLERLPGAEASLTVLNRDQLLNRFAGKLDDFYVFSNPPEELEVVTHPLLPNPTSIYARADHPLAARRGLQFSDVANEPFILREAGSGTRLVTEQLFESHGRAPNVRMELGSNEAIKQAILGGLGVSVLSQHTMGPGTLHDGIVALDVAGFPLRRWWYLVYPDDRRLSSTAHAFLEFVRQPGALREFDPGTGTGADVSRSGLTA